MNAHREAEANLRAAQAALQSAKLNLDYTQVRAPVAGRVGKLEITVGNLVAAGPGAPVLTTLVSINPIYASFNADEQIVSRALQSLGGNGNNYDQLERIPVEMTTITGDGKPVKGKMQLIDNQFDARTGTVRVRAVFDNADGRLIPGQFARLRMGQAKAEPALAVSERAPSARIRTRNTFSLSMPTTRRPIAKWSLARRWRDCCVVTQGLKSGERIVVNGLQRVRPGAVVEPQIVSMDVRAASN